MAKFPAGHRGASVVLGSSMHLHAARDRVREYGADESGARLTNLIYLANALRKLESANEQMPLQNVTPATEHVLSSTH